MAMELTSNAPGLEVVPADRNERIRHLVDMKTNGRIRELQIQMDGGTLVISGRAATYYSKQLATHAVLDVADALVIQNDVVVGA